MIELINKSNNLNKMSQSKYKWIFPYDPFVEVSYYATCGAARGATRVVHTGS